MWTWYYQLSSRFFKNLLNDLKTEGYGSYKAWNCSGKVRLNFRFAEELILTPDLIPSLKHLIKLFLLHIRLHALYIHSIETNLPQLVLISMLKRNFHNCGQINMMKRKIHTSLKKIALKEYHANGNYSDLCALLYTFSFYI